MRESVLVIFGAGSDALAHKGGRAAAVSSSAEGGCRQIRNLVATVQSRSGRRVECGNRRLGHVVRPGVFHHHWSGSHTAGIRIGGRPSLASLAIHACVKCAGGDGGRGAAVATIGHGEVVLIRFGTVPVARQSTVQMQGGSDDRSLHLQPSVGNILRHCHTASIRISGGPHQLALTTGLYSVGASAQGDLCGSITFVDNDETVDGGNVCRFNTIPVFVCRELGNCRCGRSLHGHIFGGAHLTVVAVLHSEFQGRGGTASRSGSITCDRSCRNSCRIGHYAKAAPGIGVVAYGGCGYIARHGKCGTWTYCCDVADANGRNRIH